MDDSRPGHIPKPPGNNATPGSGRPAPAHARAERLAAALRANLRRRKAADAVSADDGATAGETDPPPAASKD